MTQPRVKWNESELRLLEKQMQTTSDDMERAQRDTRSDNDLLRATQNADSARIYCSTLDEWMAQHQRVIEAINRIEVGLHSAIESLVRSEADAQAQAKQ